jgi:hypothetical protein
MARAKKSFLTRGLDKLRGAFLHAPPEPASPKVAKKTAKKTAEPADTGKRLPDSGAKAEAADASKAPDDKAPKKIPAQPWYRHRQRW